ncbi:MAG: acylphosphatase [Planctomycetia bacterium]
MSDRTGDEETGAAVGIERRRAVFFGRVQGVGFRQTAVETARGRAVAGYVRNLANGDVEVVVEGMSTAVEAFLRDVERRRADGVDGRRDERSTATGEFQGFEVRR